LELQQQINFLDISIHKTNSLEFSKYRKPTQTDHAISNLSNHPRPHKLAAFNCYVHRLLNIPLSKENFNNEVKIIKQIAYNNEFEPKLIDTLISKTKLKKLKKEAFNNPPPPINKYIAIPFLNETTNKKISTIFQNTVENIKISYKSKNSLRSHLVNSKDKIDPLSRSGIYRLNYGSCGCAYIGRTCRSLHTRINEHLNRPSSAFGEHIRASNHNFSPHKNSKILHSTYSKNFNRLDFLEDIEISKELKTNGSCLNTQVNLNRSYIPLHRRLLE
jgi:hypothetical protein